MSCSQPYVDSDPDYIGCVNLEGSYETFTFRKSTKRFIYSNTSLGGYLNFTTDTNSLAAGTCKAF